MYFYPLVLILFFIFFYFLALIEAHGRQRINTRTACPVHYESLILDTLRAVIKCFIEDVRLARILLSEYWERLEKTEHGLDKKKRHG